YRFSTTHNKLWIDGKELIDNEGLIKKYPRTDVSIALAKGLHKLMITHVSSIQGGYPTSWNDMRFQWSRFDQGQPLGWVPDEVLFCVPGAE
uniref:PA14 domain-containing protein n=1 Tax=Mesomycoplasma ovipneumoniae TaxID=29562 RepID=UPI003080C4B1